MATFRYLFCDALTGALQEELPLDCQSFSQQINGVGQLSGSLPLGDIIGNWRAATQPKRSLIIVLRDDAIAWGGIINKRRPASGGTVADIGAITLEGWLAKQELWADLTYTGVDAFTIVRGILTQVASVTGGDMRIDDGVNTAGYVETVTYLAKDSPKALDAITKLAEADPGFEFTIRWSRSGQVFTPALTMSTPGLNVGLDGVLLEYPGNLADYGYDEEDTANKLTGVGADSGGTPLIARVTSSAEISAGYPAWYDQVQAKDETSSTRLTARTTTALNAGLTDNVPFTGLLRGDAEPHFGDFPLGIPARLRAESLYDPAGTDGIPSIDVTRRIVGWSVTPKNDSTQLTLAATTGKIRLPARQRTVADYMRGLDRRVRDMESRT